MLTCENKKNPPFLRLSTIKLGRQLTKLHTVFPLQTPVFSNLLTQPAPLQLSGTHFCPCPYPALHRSALCIHMIYLPHSHHLRSNGLVLPRSLHPPPYSRSLHLQSNPGVDLTISPLTPRQGLLFKRLLTRAPTHIQNRS